MSMTPSERPAPPVRIPRAYNPLTEQEKQDILDTYEQGITVPEIAQSMGRVPQTIYNFIKRVNQQNPGSRAALEMSMNSEADISGDSATVFQDCLELGGYSKRQVLSFQETGLVWKMMSQLTNMSGFKADRVTLVIGGNAEGDWKLKPLLVYHTENPRALRGYIKEHFPVIWKAHPQVRVTNEFLQSYVVGYLSSACKEYAMANNLPNKFLLILDKHSAYPPSMSQWAENIEVLLLPTDMQPMDLGVTDIFKRYYHRRVMEQLAKAIKNNRTTQESFWKEYNIKKAIHNISHSWDQVEQSLMNTAWSEVWPEAVSDSWKFPGIKSHQQQLTSDLVRFSHKAGISQVNEEGVEALLASHAEVPSEEEHAQLEPEENEDSEQQEQTQGLNKNKLKELTDAINKASAIAGSCDINMSRSDKFSRALERATMPYQKMNDDLF